MIITRSVQFLPTCNLQLGEALFHCSMAQSSTEANEFPRGRECQVSASRWSIAMSLEGDEGGGREEITRHAETDDDVRKPVRGRVVWSRL